MNDSINQQKKKETVSTRLIKFSESIPDSVISCNLFGETKLFLTESSVITRATTARWAVARTSVEASKNSERATGSEAVAWFTGTISMIIGRNKPGLEERTNERTKRHRTWRRKFKIEADIGATALRELWSPWKTSCKIVVVICLQESRGLSFHLHLMRYRDNDLSVHASPRKKGRKCNNK